jgi:hypothetical protein
MTGEFRMPACDLATLTRCFESSFAFLFPGINCSVWNVLPFALFCKKEFGREGSDYYAKYLSEAFHIQDIFYLNVCPKLCFGRRTTDEQRNQSKFNALRRESPSRAGLLPNMPSSDVAAVSVHTEE